MCSPGVHANVLCVRWNGPCARPNGYCSPQSHFSAAGEPVGLCEFSRKRRALPLKARECPVCSPQGKGFPPLYQQVRQLTQMAPGVMGCFVVLLTRELALSLETLGFDMAAARMCAHGTPDSCVPHGEVHPTWGAQPIGRC